MNSVLSVSKRPSEHVQMQLLYSTCVPKLTYGAAVKDLTSNEKHQYNVAVNNAVRSIFRFRYWQSIRQLRKFPIMIPLRLCLPKQGSVSMPQSVVTEMKRSNFYRH